MCYDYFPSKDIFKLFHYLLQIRVNSQFPLFSFIVPILSSIGNHWLVVLNYYVSLSSKIHTFAHEQMAPLRRWNLYTFTNSQFLCKDWQSCFQYCRIISDNTYENEIIFLYTNKYVGDHYSPYLPILRSSNYYLSAPIRCSALTPVVFYSHFPPHILPSIWLGKWNIFPSLLYHNVAQLFNPSLWL